MGLTPEQEAIVEDTYLSLISDREMYLWGKNFFTPSRLILVKTQLTSIFGGGTYKFRVGLGRKYLGRSNEEMLEIMERFYYHLFGKDLYPKESSQEEINEFVDPSSGLSVHAEEHSVEIHLGIGSQRNPFIINKIKEKEMSIEAKNVNVPVATVTLVYGQCIKSMDESSLVDFHSVIEGKKKAFAELDQKSAYYKAKIASIEEAKKLVAAELDSRV